MVIPGGFGVRGIEGKIAAAAYAREHGIPCLGLCLGLQVMTIEFARNVLGLTGANSTEFDTASPHPVIDLMDAQRDVVDMGGTMRLGAYYAVLAPGTKVHEAYGEPVVSRAPPPPLRVQQRLPQSRFEAAGFLLSGAVARPAPGRVHGAGRPPVLGRHPGPPRVQEPARPARTRCSAS